MYSEISKRKAETDSPPSNPPNNKLKFQVYQKYEKFTPTFYLESIAINDTFV